MLAGRPNAFDNAEAMNRDQLVRMLRREARQKGLTLTITTFRGKGSHVLAATENGRTTLADRDYSPALVARLRRALGL